MYSRRTVFIIGAGASSELKFPLGSQLKSEVAKLVNIYFERGFSLVRGDQVIVAAVQRYCQSKNYNPNSFYAAGRQMAAALPLAISIDNFLEAHAGNEMLERVGKLAIAKAILDAERATPIYVRNPSDGIDFPGLEGAWLTPLARTLTEGIHKKDARTLFERVSFVIFNYDRSVEAFLWHALQAYYGVDERAVSEILNLAHFHHPYGSTGRLSWQVGADAIADYGEDVHHDRLIDIANGILTFSEQVASERRAAMISDINDAETVVFLRYGFLEQNMRLLKVDTPTAARRVYATAKGFSKSDCEVITDSIRGMLLKSDVPVDLQNQLTEKTGVRVHF